MDQADDVLANLVAITGVDEAAAIALLEATDFNLEQAVNLHWGMTDQGAGTDNHASSAAGANAAAGIPADLEDEVRAPLPSKIDRLYGDRHEPRRPGSDAAGGSGRLGPQYGAYGQGPTRPQPAVDIFRDIKAESTTRPAQGKGGPLAPSLSDMFRPPTALTYTGDMQAAAQVAASQDKWLMINVQSNSEFGSHQLNRDTWTHEAVVQAIGGMFLFIQLQDDTQEGKQACAAYHLHKLPVVLVLDPITGGKLYERTGFVDAEKLLEDLVPFMDHGPKDPGASGLAKQSLRRGPAGTSRAPAGTSRAPAPPPAGARPALSEDEELAMAIAASMEGGRGQAGAEGEEGLQEEDNNDDDDSGVMEAAEDPGEARALAQRAAAATHATTQATTEAAAPGKRLTPEQAAQVQQQAAARLPAEPSTSDSGSCGVALRLPGGERRQRRFASSDPLQVLHDLVLSIDVEAAAGRPFSLGLAGPGARPLTDTRQSLTEAGASNAVVTVTWDSSPWP